MKKPFIYLLTAGLAVSLIANQGTAYAVEPTTSGESDTNIEFTGGAYGIKNVPVLTFNSTQIKDENSNGIKAGVTNNFGFVDHRGTGEGWTVTAALSDFSTENREDVVTLPGASIAFSDAVATTDSTQMDILKKPSLKDELILSAGSAADVNFAVAEGKTADQDFLDAQGLGNWTFDWNESNPVSLHVPGGVASSETHTATITWTLQNTPEV